MDEMDSKMLMMRLNDYTKILTSFFPIANFFLKNVKMLKISIWLEIVKMMLLL